MVVLCLVVLSELLNDLLYVKAMKSKCLNYVRIKMLMSSIVIGVNLY